MEKAGVQLVSHWNTFIDGLSFSSDTFYEYLKGVITSRELKGVSIDKVQFAQTSIISARRLYLRVKNGTLTYYICAAPYGQGFFVSSWLINRIPVMKWLMLKIPFFGKGLANFFFPETFYTVDTTNMYLTVIHGSIVNTVNHIVEEGGKRPLPEFASKPIMRDYFKR